MLIHEKTSVHSLYFTKKFPSGESKKQMNYEIWQIWKIQANLTPFASWRNPLLISSNTFIHTCLKFHFLQTCLAAFQRDVSKLCVLGSVVGWVGSVLRKRAVVGIISFCLDRLQAAAVLVCRPLKWVRRLCSVFTRSGLNECAGSLNERRTKRGPSQMLLFLDLKKKTRLKNWQFALRGTV